MYSELKNVCVWVKDSPGMGSLYRSQHEVVRVFRMQCEQVALVARAAEGIRAGIISNVASISAVLLQLHVVGGHPTVKPAALVADAIMDCTARRDIVLDGFLGSGTTVIAAERTAAGATEWSWIHCRSIPSCGGGRRLRVSAHITQLPGNASTNWRQRRKAMSTKEGNYEVGYRRPPRQTRFKKGRSGNPRGRPPGSRNFASLVDVLLLSRS